MGLIFIWKCLRLYSIFSGEDLLIVLTASMPFETAWISSQLTTRRHVPLGKFIALQGFLHKTSVLIFNFGVGKTNASHGTTLLLENFSPTLFLLIGCGGAYRQSGLAPGNLAMANEEIFGDEGVITPHGWRSTQFLKLPLLRKGEEVYYNHYKINNKLLDTALKILTNFDIKVGPFVTISEVSGTQEKAKEMEKRFNGICENMEGASVAQLCTLYDIPFLEIRGISNLVKERNKEEWDLPAAANISQKAAIEIITQWGG